MKNIDGIIFVFRSMLTFVDLRFIIVRMIDFVYGYFFIFDRE